MSKLISDWDLVFSSSLANGAKYEGDSLPVIGWLWPTGTWFQRRLAKVRGEELARLNGKEVRVPKEKI